MRKHLGLLLILTLSFSVDTLSQSVNPDDQYWNDRFTFGGPNSYVTHMAFDEAGHLTVAGYFRSAGSQIARNVARWDGARWHAVGDGLTSQAAINNLLVDNNGSLSLVGWDLTEMNIGRGNDILAFLEGGVWTSKETPSGWYGVARTSTVDEEGTYYVAGDIHISSDISSRRILMYDGTTWSALAGDMDGDTRSIIIDDDGNLYATGRFESVDGMQVNNIAMWDGSSWMQLGDGLASGSIHTMAVDTAGNLYAGGEFTIAGLASSPNIAMWDGRRWNPVGDGFDGSVWALSVDANGILYVGGGGVDGNGNSFGEIRSWDGVSWSSVGELLDAVVITLAVSQHGTVYAGGVNLLSGEMASNVVAWNGSDWDVVAETPGYGLNQGTTAVVADASCDVYVAGPFSLAGGVSVDKVARWDNEQWHPIGSAIDGRISVLALSAGGSLYAAGDFAKIGDLLANSVAMWNGIQWLPVGTGLKSGEYPGRVHALVVAEDGVLYAGGEFSMAGDTPVNNIAKWNGTAWEALGNGLTGGEHFTSVRALDIDSNGNLYVGGEFEIAGIVSAKNIAMWDGKAWSRLGSGLDDRDTQGSVRALAIDENDKLYAGGSFSIAGNVQAPAIASWDGFTWRNIGIGFNTVVTSLAVEDGGYLYIGGQFSAFGSGGDIPVNHVARWDGVTLSHMGSGVDNDVIDMALDGRGNLYMAGFINAAGNKVSVGIAQWEIRQNDSSGCAERSEQPAVSSAITSFFPNPFTDQLALEIIVTEPQHLVVEVYDATGRFVEQLYDGPVQAYQSQRLRFNGTERANGTYFIRLTSDVLSEVRAVTLLR
ncbi:MAG: T9SS type A sorting domain-containing protein [Bacteroidota bacterium]